MASIDLTSMSKAELQSLQKDVTKAIADFDDRQKRDALAKLEAQAREMGFSLAELTGAKKAKSTNPPKYRNPENAEQTWTGRGRQPGWVKDLLASGKSLDDALI
ncbi:MAG: H-NS histone family protein [Pseudomonadota bacterium]